MENIKHASSFLQTEEKEETKLENKSKLSSK